MVRPIVRWSAAAAGVAALLTPLLARQERPHAAAPSLPRSSDWSAPDHLRQSPFLVARPDGGALLGALEWQPEVGDSIVVVPIAADGTLRQESTGDNVERRIATGGALFRPIGVAERDGRVRLLWTQLVDGVGELFTAQEQKDGSFSPPAPLTHGPAPNMNVAAALGPDGRTWLAWESERAGRVVLAAPLAEAVDGVATLGEPLVVGEKGRSHVDPAIASGGGKLWLAWSVLGQDGRGDDFEIVARSLDPTTSALGPALVVSDDDEWDDVHPDLAVDGAGVPWIAWDRLRIGSRGSSGPLAAGDDGSLKTMQTSLGFAALREGRDGAVDFLAGDPLAGAGEEIAMEGGHPHLAFDGAGRLFVAYRAIARGATLEVFGWRSRVRCLASEPGGAAAVIDGSEGASESPVVVGGASGALVAFQCDERLRDAGDQTPVPAVIHAPLAARGVKLRCWFGNGGIGVAAASAGGTGRPEMKPRPPHHASVSAAAPRPDQSDDPFVTGARRHTMSRGESTWTLFYGDVHRHSSASRCSRGREPAPWDRWVAGRDVLRCDFMALTDHSNQIEPLEWRSQDKLRDLFTNASFLPLSGFEWATTRYGHQNVILAGALAPLIESRGEVTDFYAALPDHGAVAIPHHSADFMYPSDFSALHDDHSRLIEVYQAQRGNFEFDGCFKQAAKARVAGSFVHDAFDRGLRFGIVASPDHGQGMAYAGVFAPRLGRNEIVDAMESRRTLGATTKGMFLDFRLGDAVMGEEVTVSGAPHLTRAAHAGGEIADVVLFRNGAVFRSVGRGEVMRNLSAPARLVVKARSDAGRPLAGAVSVRATGGHFSTLFQRPTRASGRARTTDELEPATAWSGRGDAAHFDFAAAAMTGEPTIDLFAPPGTSLEITAPDGRHATTCDALAKAPLVIPLADGGTAELSAVLGDSVIDLEKGLGVSDFTGEWDDPDLPVGSSWYYARIVRRDGEMAWSSPIFVTRADTK